MALSVADTTFDDVTQTSLTVSTVGASDGAEPYSYLFERSPDDGSDAPTGDWTTVGAEGAETTQDDTDLTPGAKYWYRVTVTDDNTDTATSTPQSVTMDPPDLVAGALSVTTDAAGFALSWEEATGGTPPYSYQVKRGLTEDAIDTDIGEGTEETSYTDPTPYTNYWYQVLVTDDDDREALSGAVQAIRNMPPTDDPAGVEGLSAVLHQAMSGARISRRTR